MKKPKQLRMDGDHVLLLTVLRSYLGVPYDNLVGEAAIRCLAEQVAATFAKRGQAAPLAALIPLMNEASRMAMGEASAHDPYRYDPALGQVLRWESGGYQPVLVAFPL